MTKNTTQTVALSIRDLHKSFGVKRVHQGISFDLYNGEILGLFGGSGTGKSVVLRSIIGLEKPDRGQIIFDGQDITRFNEDQLVPVRKRIAYVFQNGALFDSLTVEDNIAYPLREHTNLSEPEIAERVNQSLKKLDMSGTNLLLPNELSGGMQKRAGLARATILNPDITLFDEPTAGLDPVNTKRLTQNIIDLKKSGLTGIFVTHDIPSALEISDRIAILLQGKIHVIAPVDEIIHSKDPLVRSFLTGEH